MKGTNEQLAVRVSLQTIAGNVILSVFKLFAGLFARSGAMLSDAVHSISDVVSTVIVIIGVKCAGKEADKEHPYGHERLECVAAVILSVILFAVGLGIGWSGIESIISSEKTALPVPGALALVAAIVSIGIKEGMYRYTRHAAKKINSGALMADAWHHRSDALSSIGSFIGILGAQFGFPVLDPLAGLVICVFILKAAIQIFVDAVNKMLDKSCDDELIGQLRSIILDQPGVLGIDDIKTRIFGDKIYVDVEILVDEALPLVRAHQIAHDTHDAVEHAFASVKHCMIHVNPNSGEPPCPSAA